MRINSSGNVGIGTSSTTNDAKLIVVGSDGKHPTIKTNDGGANGFTMLADNYTATESQVNFGVGYSSSDLVLSRCVKPSDAAEKVYLSSQAQGACKPSAFVMDGDGGFRFLNTNTSATTAVDTAVSLSERMRIDSSGNVTIGSSSLSANAALKFQADTGTFTLEHERGSHALTLSDSDGTGEILRIDTSGNVGIGTSSPDAPLTVKGETLVQEAASNGNAAIRVQYGDDGNTALRDRARLMSVGYHGVLELLNSSNVLTAKVSADGVSYFNGGNVGIGTSSPSADLSVGSTSTSSGDVHLRTTKTAFSITPSNTDAGGILLDLGWVGGGQGPMKFGIGSSEKMRLDSSGSLVLQDGTTYTSNAPTHRGSLILAGASGATSYGGIEFHPNAGGGAGYGSKIGASDAEMTFSTRSNSATFTQRMVIKGDGNLLVGTTSNASGQRLHLESAGQFGQLGLRHSSATAGKFWYVGPASNNTFAIYNQSPAGVYLSDGATSWTGASDENLKENIVELTGALDKVKDYRCVEYNLISDETNSKKIGFIAQDWQEDYSQVVSQDPDGNLGIQYTETIPVLLKAIQEQQTQIDALQSEINLLKGE